MENLHHTEKLNKMKYTPREHVDKIVEEVLCEFDFPRVMVTMSALGWTWGMNPTPPTIEDLKRTGERIMRGAIDGAIKCKTLNESEGYIYATGGFKATAYRNRYKTITSVQLEFIVTSWESDGD
jgi:hypothetical protein